MAGCCNEENAHLDALQQRQARMLWAVLLINSTMFLIEFGAGWWFGSTALLGDSLDMLGDALVYGLSLFVIGRSLRWKAVSAGVKGTIMLGFGVLVLGEAIVKALYGHAPVAASMVGIGGLALATNIACLCLLTRYRDADVNMRSSWVCSRNDLFANSGVILAGLLVASTGSIWPDVLVGTAIAGLFLQSSVGVLKQARQRYRDATPTAAAG